MKKETKIKSLSFFINERTTLRSSVLSQDDLCIIDYCKKKNIPRSEVFQHIANFWNSKRPVTVPTIDLVRCWYLATMELVTERELSELLERIYAKGAR